MRSLNIAATTVAAVFVTSLAFAQTPQTQRPVTPQTPQTQPPQNPPPPPTVPPSNPTSQTPTSQTPASPQTKTETAAMQTFTGCVMSEPDYRRAHNLGAGAAGGLGLGDEFVLVDVKTSPARDASGSTASSSSASSTSSQSSMSSSTSSSSTSTTSSSTCADRGTAYRLTGTQEERIKGLVGHQLEVEGRFKHADDATMTTGSTESGKLPAEIEIVSFREVPRTAIANEPVMATPPTSSTTVTEPRPQATQPMPRTTMPDTTPRTTTPNPPTTTSELPHTASPAPLLALIGVLALSSGFALTLLRRRAA